MTDDGALPDTLSIDQVWTFFKNEQKINKGLRQHLKALTAKLEVIERLEKTIRDMQLENSRLRAEVKQLRAAQAALGERP